MGDLELWRTRAAQDYARNRVESSRGGGSSTQTRGRIDALLATLEIMARARQGRITTNEVGKRHKTLMNGAGGIEPSQPNFRWAVTNSESLR